MTSKMTATIQAGVLGMLYISALLGEGLRLSPCLTWGVGIGGGGPSDLGLSWIKDGFSTSSVTALGVGIASRSPHFEAPLAAAPGASAAAGAGAGAGGAA